MKFQYQISLWSLTRSKNRSWIELRKVVQSVQCQLRREVCRRKNYFCSFLRKVFCPTFIFFLPMRRKKTISTVVWLIADLTRWVVSSEANGQLRQAFKQTRACLCLTFNQTRAGLTQTCTNTRNTSIPPGVLSFQVAFVDKFRLMDGIYCQSPDFKKSNRSNKKICRGSIIG